MYGMDMLLFVLEDLVIGMLINVLFFCWIGLFKEFNLNFEWYVCGLVDDLVMVVDWSEVNIVELVLIGEIEFWFESYFNYLGGLRWLVGC